MIEFEEAEVIVLVAGKLLALARAHRSVIPPPEIVATMCAECARELTALLPDETRTEMRR